MKIKRVAKIVAMLLFMFTSSIFSQNSVLIVADSTNSMDADISYYYPDSNFGNLHRFRADAWTYGGSPEYIRAALWFDLSMFCANTQVLEARLELYHDDDFEHSTLSGSNSCYLKKIVQKWSESSITWNNQPEVTDLNRVILNSSESSNQDYLNIDVTNLIQEMVSNQESNFGFLLQLVNENPYRRMNFASSEHNEYLKHPRLSILFENCNIGYADTVVINDTISIIDTVVVFDSISVTDTLIIDAVLAGSSSNFVNQIRVYPNPTKDKIYINNGDYLEMKNYSVRIVNVNSTVLYKSQIDTKVLEVNLSDLGSTGLYFIQIFDSESVLVSSKKILLE